MNSLDEILCSLCKHSKKLKDALEREKYKNNNDDLFTYKYEIIIFTQNINVL